MKRNELALRPVPAANVLGHDDVAGCGKTFGHVRHGHFVVRGPGEQNGIWACPVRSIDVRSQNNAVTHPGRDVRFDDHSISSIRLGTHHGTAPHRYLSRSNRNLTAVPRASRASVVKKRRSDSQALGDVTAIYESNLWPCSASRS